MSQNETNVQRGDPISLGVGDAFFREKEIVVGRKTERRRELHLDGESAPIDFTTDLMARDMKIIARQMVRIRDESYNRGRRVERMELCRIISELLGTHQLAARIEELVAEIKELRHPSCI